jgi:uncharacterized Zn finger protein
MKAEKKPRTVTDDLLLAFRVKRSILTSVFTVPSESLSNVVYDVTVDESNEHCTCPQNFYRRTTCKHIRAVRLILKLIDQWGV